MILNPQQINDLGRSLIASLLLWSNVHFFLQSGYFDTAAITKPLLHMWSLSLEEQFYLVYPVVLSWLFRKRFKTVHYTWLMTALVVVMIVATYFVTRDFPATSFFLLPFRFHEFLVGAALNWVVIKTSKRIVHDLLFVLGLLLIIYASISFDGGTPFPGLYALVPCIGTAFVIMSGHRTRLAAVLSNPPMSFVGRTSYSAYLVHWPAVVLYMIVTQKPLDGIDKAALLGLTFVVSSFMYFWIENVFRSSARVYLDSDVLKYATTGTVCMLAVALFFALSDGLAWRYPSQTREFLTGQAGFKRDLFYGGSQCVESRESSSCKSGAGRMLLAIGDSHAEMLFSGLVDEATKTSRSVRLFSEGTCALFSLEANAFKGKQCKKTRKDLSDYLSTPGVVSNIDVLLISQRWWLFRSEDQSLELFISQVLKRIEEFVGKYQITAPVVLVGQIPEIAQYGGIYDCIGRPPYLSSMGDCSYSSILVSNVSRNREINVEFSKQIKTSPLSKQISFFDPFTKLCDDEKCRQIDSDLGILYSDGDHLSLAGARYLVPSIIRTSESIP